MTKNMQNLRLLIFSLFLFSFKSFAQCPTAGFSVPDSSCSSAISFINTSTGASTYNWDFCPGDLSGIPTGVNAGTFGGTFSFPNQVKVVNDNGNYHVFVTNYLGALTRLDFGNSLENPSPGIFTYTNGGFGNPFGLDVIKDGNTWYAMLTDDGNSHLFRINLGTTISANIFSTTDLGVFAFDVPVVLKIMNDNGNFYVFVTDRSLNNITKFSFGNSLSNAIVNSSTLTHPSFQSPYGIDITYDCSLNKYIGFVANYGVSSISVIDFGNALSNTGSIIHTLVSPFAGPTNINVLRDGNKWHLLMTCQDVNSLAQLILGNNLLNTTPAVGFTGNIGQMDLPRGLSSIKDSSKWYTFAINTLGQNLSRIKFENNCTASVPSATNPLPQNIFYTGIGWQTISLAATNNGFTNYFTDSTYSNGLPCVDFSYSAACENQAVSFTDNSSTGAGTITGWQWNFGDGSPINNSQNPVHTFTNDSTYTVTLTATSSNGLSNSKSVTVIVHKIPDAAFNFANNQCANTLVQFTDASTAPPGDNISSWEWNFGDGSPLATNKNPKHEFVAAATYTVQLIAFSNSGCSDTIRQNITILPAAAADFSVSQTCVGETTLFTNTTDTVGAGTVTYQWNFGDSGTSGTTSPSHLYASVPANYNVQLIATSGNNCKDTLETIIRISSKANPGYTFSPLLACIGNSIQFADTSTISSGDSIVLRTWDFGDGSGFATGANVTHLFSNSGTFNVTLTVSSLTSCDTFITKTVTVIESPVADFSFNNVCLDSAIVFTDLSTTPSGSVIDSILWDFGDNTFDTGTTVSHTYATAGTYNVIHTVINNIGCYGTITKQVTVYDKPVASFSNTIAYAGDPTTFTNTSTIANPNDSIVGFLWNFPGSSSSLENPIFIFNAIGTFPVTLIVTSSHGCQDSTTLQIQVNASIAQCAVSGFTVGDTVCAGNLVLTNVSTGATSYQWDFCAGDLDTIPSGTNVGGGAGLSFPNQIKVINDNGNYYGFISNYLGAITRLDFGTSLENPSPGVFTYPNSGFGNPYGIDIVKDGNTWYALITDDGNSNLFRLDLGTTISDNIFSYTSLGVFSFDLPVVVKIVNDNGNYYAFVTDRALNNITKFDFGNSLANSIVGSSTIIDPTFQSPYGIDITYDCTLGKYIGFVSNYGVSSVSVIDFGNSLSNAGSVIHTLTSPFAGPTNLNIAHDGNKWHLLITFQDANAIGQLVIGNNLLNISPLNGYTGSVGTLNLPRGLSCVKDSSRWYGMIANTLGQDVTRFKFENSCSANISASTDSLPQNIYYSAIGWQHITLASNHDGLSSYANDSTFSNGLPCVDFSFSNACQGLPISFFDQSSIGGATITSWLWNFGDGSVPDITQNPVHTYLNSGTYFVTLTVTSSTGLINSFSSNIIVRAIPAAEFSFLNNQCSKAPVLFTDGSTAAAGDSIVQWIWDFGDATPLVNLQNPVHSFDTAGTYLVQLIAIANGGCSDVSTHTITILPAPVADFTISQTCVGETTLFTNGTTLSGGGALTYEWNFGDAVTSTAISPSHNYALLPAFYPVQLIATSTANLCTDTLVTTIRISSKANPGFIFNPVTACIGNTTQFIDTSTIASGDSIILRTWDFGDSSGLIYGDTVSHVFANSGTFIVTLTIKSQTDCDSSITKSVTVLESPVAAFSFSGNVCLDSTIIFTDLSTTPSGTVLDSILWDFGDSNTDTGSIVSHTYSTAGTYNVTQTVINNFGCSGTITQQVTVYDKPVAAFTAPFACAGNALFFINNSTVQNDVLTGYNWDFGDLSTPSSQQNPSHVYIAQGTFTVNLLVMSSHGCTGETTQSVLINSSPDFDFASTFNCYGDSTKFTYTSLLNPDPTQTWLWNFGDGSPLSPLVNPVHFYNSSGAYTVTLVGTGINTCSKTLNKTIIINPKPNAGIIVDSLNCLSTNVAFTDSSTIGLPGLISQWSWNFGDLSPIDISPNTSHIYSNDTSYTVTHIVTSDLGCSDTAIKVIQVLPAPIVSFTPDPDFGSPPLIVQFQNTTTGAATYQWNFGDSSPLDFQTAPTHVYTDTGVYTVTLIATSFNGCSDTANRNVSVLVPYLDLAITDVFAVPQNNLLSISANLSNLGNVVVNKFQISVRTENGSPINEQWTSLNGLTPGQAYTYNFAARYEIDPNYIPAFFCVEISQINGGIDSVEANNRKCTAVNDGFELFDIYPNPSTNEIILGVNIPYDGTIEISFYNSAGQVIKKETEVPVTKGYNEFTESVRNFANGVYACVIRFADDLQTKKIIKK